MNSVRLSMLATLVLVGCIAYLVVTHTVLGTGPITLGLQAAAAALMVWARLTFGLRSFHAGANPTEGPLVTAGPYGIVRNPIYTAILLFVGAAGAAHPSWMSLLVFAVACAAVMVRVLSEESYLRARYSEYRDYERRVKRLVPLIF